MRIIYFDEFFRWHYCFGSIWRFCLFGCHYYHSCHFDSKVRYFNKRKQFCFHLILRDNFMITQDTHILSLTKKILTLYFKTLKKYKEKNRNFFNFFARKNIFLGKEKFGFFSQFFGDFFLALKTVSLPSPQIL